MESTQHPAAAYESFAYLEPQARASQFSWAPQDEQPVGTPFDDPADNTRLARILSQSLLISLHDHPILLPDNIDEIPLAFRSRRIPLGYRGLRHSRLTAVFDNLLGPALLSGAAPWRWDDVLTDLGMRLCDIAHQDYVFLATRASDITLAKQTGRLALIAGLEAATPIETDLDRLDVLYGFGVRQIGIAYSESNALGSGLREARDGGLTDFGRAAIVRMNHLGMAIDLSHSSDLTCLDVIDRSTTPVLITHAGARRVWPSPRMKPDEVIQRCAERGGVIGIEAAPNTTRSCHRKGHDIEAVLDHFQYCADLVGIEHVAFGPDTMFGDHVGLHRVLAKQLSTDAIKPAGGDADGVTTGSVAFVAGVENPAEAFVNLAAGLIRRGYTDSDISDALGGNVVRVLADIWR